MPGPLVLLPARWVRRVHAATDPPWIREARNIAKRLRRHDNIFVERLWRTVKYEEVYLKDYADPGEARRELRAYLRFYNDERPHQSLSYRTPADVHFAHLAGPR